MVKADNHSHDEGSLGELYVSTKLAHGQERLRIVFTPRRLIVAHIGKRGVGEGPAALLFGAISQALEDLLSSGRERAKRKTLSPQQILEMDAENFEVPYQEIVSLECQAMRRLIIVTTEKKFDLVSLQPIDPVLTKHMTKVLGEKMTMQ